MCPEQRHPPMQMRTRCPSRHPDATDRAPCLHTLALFNRNHTHMDINAGQSMAMVQNYCLAGEKHVLMNQHDAPRRRGSDGCTGWCRHINAIVILAWLAVKNSLGAEGPGARDGGIAGVFISITR